MLIKKLATLGPIGYVPAPGTCASLCALPLVYFFNVFNVSLLVQLACIALLSALALYVVRYAIALFVQYDPSEIVIDELIGCLITFIAVPISLTSIVFGFILFRFFDIVKPFGIKQLEMTTGAWGIVLDDIAAGVTSCAILHMLVLAGVI